MSSYREQIEEALRATQVHSPTSHSWFGQQLPPLSSRVRRSLTAWAARGYLLFNLEIDLYRNFYCRGAAIPVRREPIDLPVSGVSSFLKKMQAANSGSGCWDEGWQVRAIENGEVVVCKHGLNLWVRPDCLAPIDGGIVTQSRVSLLTPKEALNFSPGFYMAKGDQQLTQQQGETIVRLYWNLTAKGAVRFVRQATLRLNRDRIPFDLKAINDERGYCRCDAVVLYIHKVSYGLVEQALEGLYQDVASDIKTAIPIFTKKLAPGLGLAEDPGQDFSFGEHRCRLLAEGILRAHEQGKRELKERLQVATDCFEDAGIDLKRPFLNPGSADDYHFRTLPRCFEARRSASRAGEMESDSQMFLRVADTIARRLSREAVWDGARCNWLGADPQDADGHLLKGYRALGSELYDGTTGIALFLAELHSITRDAAARRTALGAIRQALSRVAALPPAARCGLYTGVVGIALGAARAGTSLGEEDLREQASRLVGQLASEKHEERQLDLLAGSAGAIAGLLALRNLLEDESLVDFAVRLADDLLRSAEKSEVGYSWGSPAFPRQRHLTGYSHGAAGVGYALLEVFSVTREAKYRTGAERAFAYERFWFDPEQSNWPDFRATRRKGRQGSVPQSFATFWCHGAPGIALSRLRAFQITGDETCKAEAIIALRATRKDVQKCLREGSANYSLCHGLAGNSEVLLQGCRVFGQDNTADCSLVTEVARFGCEKYVRREPWPCGAGDQETPGLMVGLAGIGYFYLRLHAPRIPSILILEPETYCTYNSAEACELRPDCPQV